jgi:hypothetical protein
MKERRTLIGSAVETGAALRAIAMLAGYASRANRTGRHHGALQSWASTKDSMRICVVIVFLQKFRGPAPAVGRWSMSWRPR